MHYHSFMKLLISFDMGTIIEPGLLQRYLRILPHSYTRLQFCMWFKEASQKSYNILLMKFGQAIMIVFSQQWLILPWSGKGVFFLYEADYPSMTKRAIDKSYCTDK